MYPFASLADVRAWQAGYESGGHQPWHRSPDLTATAFAAFLGYTDVTQVASSAVSGGDAHVAVGIKLPDGTISTAAIIHLALFGSGKDAPWGLPAPTTARSPWTARCMAARCPRR